MKISKYNLIAYSMSFISFIFPKTEEIEEIILFGSVARGEADINSDIDLFFNTKKNEEKIKKVVKEELNKFYNSKIYEIWNQKGIKNQISIKVGNLDEWELKRSIISDGIILYSRYKESPKDIKLFVQFNLNPIKNIAKRNKIIRKIFGRKEKNHFSNGILENLNGKKLSPASFIVPKENSQKIIEILGKEKINYKLFEIWADQI